MYDLAGKSGGYLMYDLAGKSGGYLMYDLAAIRRLSYVRPRGNPAVILYATSRQSGAFKASRTVNVGLLLS
jgi:hypothetical protein